VRGPGPPQANQSQSQPLHSERARRTEPGLMLIQELG
jgi:hypothetical protein